MGVLLRWSSRSPLQPHQTQYECSLRICQLLYWFSCGDRWLRIGAGSGLVAVRRRSDGNRFARVEVRIRVVRVWPSGLAKGKWCNAH